MKSKKARLVCDDCGCEITNPRNGELAWERKDRQRKRVLVVHAPYACERWKHQTHNLPEEVTERGTVRLDFFMGRRGLLDLLAKIESGYWPVETGLELIRRLHVPGYEQYRLFRREYNASDAEHGLPAAPDRSAYHYSAGYSKSVGNREGVKLAVPSKRLENRASGSRPAL